MSLVYDEEDLNLIEMLQPIFGERFANKIVECIKKKYEYKPESSIPIGHCKPNPIPKEKVTCHSIKDVAGLFEEDVKVKYKRVYNEDELSEWDHYRKALKEIPNEIFESDSENGTDYTDPEVFKEPEP